MKHTLRHSRPKEGTAKENPPTRSTWYYCKQTLKEMIVPALIVGAGVYVIQAIGAGGESGSMPKMDRTAKVCSDVKYTYDVKAEEKERAVLSEMFKAISKKPKDGLKGRPPMQEGRQ